MKDHSVRPECQLLADGGDTGLRAARRRGCRPLRRKQGRNVLELVDGGGRAVDHLQPAFAEALDHHVLSEALQDFGIPAIRAYQQVAVALKVGGQSADELA